MTEGETQQSWGPGDAGLVPAVPSPGGKPGLAVRTEGWQTEGRLRGDPSVRTEGILEACAESICLWENGWALTWMSEEKCTLEPQNLLCRLLEE